MTNSQNNPRILIVTPEVTYLPSGMGDIANRLQAKAGGLADVSAALINTLFELGADVHVALPDYRAMFGAHSTPLFIKELNAMKRRMPVERIHLAEDRAFFYLNRIYSSNGIDNVKISLAFQREVINNIIPMVQPDLIHCNDWMTGLIPAMARQMGSPCLFTIHNIYTVKSALDFIEDRGIDAASFWEHLFFEYYPSRYEQTRDCNYVDFLTSGVFAAHFVNTVSPSFLKEVVNQEHDFVEHSLQIELANKWEENCAIGILNAPDPSFNPSIDNALSLRYDPDTHFSGKQHNKTVLQEAVGLIRDESAPLFFWPSRLDLVQKGCRLLAEILYKSVSRYWSQNLQIVFVANGDFQTHFREIVHFHNLNDRVAVCDFDEHLARLAYAASDFILMPSLFEPCGLPQMIGLIYGTLPVVRNTGGLHDTVVPMNVDENKGNGFLFDTFDSNGLLWAISQAMDFYNIDQATKEREIKRVMTESMNNYTHAATARQYIRLYEKMLARPLINTP